MEFKFLSRLFFALSFLFATMMVSQSLAIKHGKENWASDYCGGGASFSLDENIEISAGKLLFEKLKANPDCRIVALDYERKVTNFVTDRFRLFYDKELEFLVYMDRTIMKVGDDIYSWRIWPKILPSDFKDGIPYGNEKLKSIPSDYSSPKASLILAYKGPQVAIEWP